MAIRSLLNGTKEHIFCAWFTKTFRTNYLHISTIFEDSQIGQKPLALGLRISLGGFCFCQIGTILGVSQKHLLMETITLAKIRRGIFLTLFVIILLSALYSFADKQNISENREQTSSAVTVTSSVGQFSYDVELARTETERAKGLSNREVLAPNAGMLFIFDTPGEYGFWMKDTFIPLDMIWISESKHIVHIEKNVQPSSDLTTYSNEINSEDGSDAALYVLELNAGEAEKNLFAIGDEVLINMSESR